jgi:mycothiol system anti-sigma-R factor
VITCAEAVEQLWQYLEGTIEESRREPIEEHLAFCRRCCGELEFAEELRAFLAVHAHERLPDDVHARLLATLEGLERR